MRQWCYRLLGYYNIIFGAQLALVILCSVAILLHKVYSSLHHQVNFLYVGGFLLFLLLFFVVCVLAIRSGLLFIKPSSQGLRGAVLVQLVQLVSCVNHSFTYVFHFGLFYGFGFYQNYFSHRVWGEQKSLVGNALFHLGSPMYQGRIVPLHLALYVNISSMMCLLLLGYLIYSERRENKYPVLSPAHQ